MEHGGRMLSTLFLKSRLDKLGGAVHALNHSIMNLGKLDWEMAEERTHESPLSPEDLAALAFQAEERRLADEAALREARRQAWRSTRRSLDSASPFAAPDEDEPSTLQREAREAMAEDHARFHADNHHRNHEA